MSYASDQLRAALRTLPWYAAIPAIPVASIWLFFVVIGWSKPHDLATFSGIAALLGVFVWCLRQSIRVLLMARYYTR